jgi:hypothetical protein
LNEVVNIARRGSGPHSPSIERGFLKLMENATIHGCGSHIGAVYRGCCRVRAESCEDVDYALVDRTVCLVSSRRRIGSQSLGPFRSKRINEYVPRNLWPWRTNSIISSLQWRVRKFPRPRSRRCRRRIRLRGLSPRTSRTSDDRAADPARA